MKEYPVKDAASDVEVDKNMAVDVYRWLREVCSTKLLATPIILGGPGVIVQVDESLYRHKPKVMHMLYTLAIKFSPILFFSIIVAAQPAQKYGCLEWSTPPIHQH